MAANANTLAQLPQFRAAAERVRDLLLADLVTLGETPAPTFEESARSRLVADRFAEAGLEGCAVDDLGSACGVLAGTDGHRQLLVVTNVDSLVTQARDQTIELAEDHFVGPFVGDNALAVAALTTLPALLDAAGVRLKANVMLLAAARTLERGNQEGLRHFLAQHARRLNAGICLESVQLGRLNYACVGVLRGEIRCRLPENYDWAKYGSTGTIAPMGELITRINSIPIPGRPMTSVILGSIRGGIAGRYIARETVLAFEVRSESLEILAQLREQIDDVAEDTAARSGMHCRLDVIAERPPASIDISHPLVRTARNVLTALGIQPQLYPTTTQLGALLDAKVAGVTVGLTHGARLNELDEIDERMDIPALATGLAQVVGILKALDEESAP